MVGEKYALEVVMGYIFSLNDKVSLGDSGDCSLQNKGNEVDEFEGNNNKW